jgi:hypothetical protein
MDSLRVYVTKKNGIEEVYYCKSIEHNKGTTILTWTELGEIRLLDEEVINITSELSARGETGVVLANPQQDKFDNEVFELKQKALKFEDDTTLEDTLARFDDYVSKTQRLFSSESSSEIREHISYIEIVFDMHEERAKSHPVWKREVIADINEISNTRPMTEADKTIVSGSKNNLEILEREAAMLIAHIKISLMQGKSLTKKLKKKRGK